jgi:hypothetical protein
LATNLEASARLAGSHQWLESRLFEVLGEWVADTESVPVRLMFDRHSRHGAWRAAQWWDRLPVLADLDRSALCVPAAPNLDPVMSELGRLTEPVDRMAGAYRFAFPRAWAAYRSHRGAAAEPGDGATLRTLEIASSDLAADWMEGEAVLQGLLTRKSEVARSAATVAALEERLAAG